MHRLGLKSDCKCEYCGHAVCSQYHILWQCNYFADIRKETAVDLPVIPINVMSIHIRRGIAPAMRAQIDKSVWGLDVARMQVNMTEADLRVVGIYADELPAANREIVESCGVQVQCQAGHSKYQRKFRRGDRSNVS